MSAKIAVVTGTSTGLGLSLSLQLARAGYKVYATMRSPAKGETLRKQVEDEKLQLEILPLDVQDDASVAQCFRTILEKENGIDLLVNNAGQGFVRASEQATIAEVQNVMDLNFTGAVRCTNAVLPSMRTRKSGHIVYITSVGGLVGQPMNEIYCAAKFAVEGYAESLATYLPQFFNIRISVVEPGGISTEFANTALRDFQVKAASLGPEYQNVLQAYAGQREKRISVPGIFQTAEEVAEKVMQVVRAEKPPFRVRTSAWSEQFTSLKTKADPDGSIQNAQVAKGVLGVWSNEA